MSGEPKPYAWAVDWFSLGKWWPAATMRDPAGRDDVRNIRPLVLATDYDPHHLRGVAQAALDDVIEAAGIDVEFVPSGDSGGNDLTWNEAGVAAIESAMARLLTAHGIKRKAS